MTWAKLHRAGTPVLAVVALAVAGVMLIVFGTRGATGRAHAQPLPEHPFAIDPSVARALAVPPAMTRPQHGSAQHACAPADSRPEVDIPALCVYAPLVPTNTDADGSLRIPEDVRTVAQDLQSVPLDAHRGTTIIAGHVDDANQGAGSFYYLYNTPPGAEIVVTGLDATVSRWRVFKVTSAHKDELPPDVFSTTGTRQLVLITCGGPLLYQPGYGNTYADNVLVYAAPA